jgi:hypothetical protein
MAASFRFPEQAPADDDVQFKETGLEMLSILVDTLADAVDDAESLGSGLGEVLQAPLSAVSSVLCSRFLQPGSLFAEWAPIQYVHEVCRAVVTGIPLESRVALPASLVLRGSAAVYCGFWGAFALSYPT